MLPNSWNQARLEDWAFGSASEVVGRQAWWDGKTIEDWQQVADAMPISALVPWTQLAVVGAVAATPRRDEHADVALAVIAASLAAAYLHGERELELSIRELVEGSFLYDVSDVRLRLMEKISKRLEGHLPDAVGAASSLVVGDAARPPGTPQRRPLYLGRADRLAKSRPTWLRSLLAVPNAAEASKMHAT